MKKYLVPIMMSCCIGIPACISPGNRSYQNHEHSENRYLFAEVLYHEFDTIKRVLQILEKAAHCLDADKPVSQETFRQIVEIISKFSDKRHQEKEDKILFPFLKNVHGNEKKDFLGRLLMEHVSARDKIRDLSESIHTIYQGKKAKKKVTKIAYSYIKHMEKHIHTEEKTLFPWIQEVLTHDEQEVLVKKFEEMEKEDVYAGIYEKYIVLIEELEKQLALYSE